MSKLVSAYDSYGDFCRDVFFTVSFEVIPSNLCLALPLKASKENIQEVLNIIDFETVQLKPVLRNWQTKDAKNTLEEEDYPYQYLFKSEESRLLLWISLNNDELYVEFAYDVANPTIEKWVLDTNHQLRSNFGEMKTPTFKVLSHNGKRFVTEKVNTGNFDSLDIKKFYNDDFEEIDSIILQSIDTPKSGLILLHGEPGTGKTSYIKNLIAKFKETNFIFVQNKFVQELLTPQFISFLLKHRNAVLIIEDAEKIIMSRETSSEASVVSTILQLTDGLFSDYLNIKIICTFNSKMEKVDKALLRKGRMIANYPFKPLAKDKTKALLQSLGFEPLEQEMTLAEIFKLKEKGFTEESPRKIGFR